MAVALCPNNRVYAWQARFGKTTGLFTSTSPTAAWRPIAGTLPDPGQGLYSFGLSIAPNSPGDGANDILFFPGYQLFRSTDSGRTWGNASVNYDAFHNDYHIVVFAPDPAPAGSIPGTYIGCDGGIALSTGFADPTVALGSTADFNAEASYSASEVLQNLNHGLHGVGVYTYASDPRFPALSYIGSQDSGIAAGSGALGWRELDWGSPRDQQEWDGYKIAATAGGDGMRVWFYLGVPNYIRLVTDHGSFDNSEVDCRLGGDGPLMVATSNMVVGLDGQCLTAGWLRDDSGNKLTSAITNVGVQQATPNAMSGIAVGITISIGDGTSSQENVVVTAVAASTFTANFTKTHKVGDAVVVQRYPIVRIDQNGTMRQISQDFGTTSRPAWIAVSPTDPNTMYCATTDATASLSRQRVFTTNVAVNANSATQWTEVSSGKPADLDAGKKFIVGMTMDASGNTYVLCNDLIHVPGTAEFSGFDTPLFTVNAGTWTGQRVDTSVPAGTFGPLAADPMQPNTLYAVRVNKVFRAVNGPGGWAWADVSAGLPGAPINDLWIGRIGDGATSRVLLRAACSTRGVFERDVTAGAADAQIALYLRANFLDLAWLPAPPSGVTNPFDGKTEVFHYQSEDIKIDAENSDGFFQTDPEAPPPISHVIFDQLQDNSEHVPATDAALIHVQVHNRSNKAANNVWVWPLYTNAAAGLPPLPANFIKNFQVNGKINPSVPTDSAWATIGPPQILNGITANSPKVASWPWTVPRLASGSPGHYCIAAFVHSAASPFTDTSRDVDDLAVRVKQLGQKNMHVGPPLDAGPFPARAAASTAPGGSAGAAGNAGNPLTPTTQRTVHTMREYVEFHNPTAATRNATLIFDFHGLPSQLRVALRLSRLETAKTLAASITGARPHGPSSARRRLGEAKSLLDDVEDFFERALDEDDDSDRKHHRRATVPIDPTIYLVDSPDTVRIDGVTLRPGIPAAAEISVGSGGTLPQGSFYWFQVQQWVGGQLAGGSIYKARIAGPLHRRPIPTPDLPDTVITNYPLWAADLITAEQSRQMMSGNGA